MSATIPYLTFTATLVPAWIPGRTFWAGFAGAAFLLHLPLVAASVRNPGQWSSALVALLMWGGAWSVAEGITS